MICMEQNNTVQVPDVLATSLAQAGQIPLPLARILAGRGIDTPQKLRAYLNPSLTMLHDPLLLKDMEPAAGRILDAVAHRERIVVYGDYDADGVTASTLLCSVLKDHGAQVEVYLPERKREGYGLHDGSIDRIIECYAPSLIVTVDCGITAFDEVERAMRMGIDVIITDHHLCPEVLPPAVACVDPKRPDQAYPFDGLAGVGVAAKLVQAMYGTDALLPYLDVVAVGTIADIVPLCDENRAMVAVGLEKLRRDPVVGLKALMQVAGCKRHPITSVDVGFMLAPRINAGGRMASAMKAYELLTCQDEELAMQLAGELNQLNVLRQTIERQIVAEAIARIESGEVDIVNRRMIVLASDDWDDGVVGIVASRLTDRFSRPVLLFSRHDGLLKGSGRSIAGIDLHGLLAPMQDMFSQFGGHTMAVGLTIREEQLPVLIAKLEEALADYPPQVFLPHAHYDEKAQLSWFTESFVQQLDCMEPVGYGNAAPLFLLENLQTAQVNTMGQDGAHIRMQVKNGAQSRCAIAFGWGGRRDEFVHMPSMSIVAQANLNRWQNRSEVQLQMKAALATRDAAQWARYLASRDDSFEDSFYMGVYAYAPDAQTAVLQYEEALDELLCVLPQAYQGTLVVCNSLNMSMRLLSDLSRQIAQGTVDVALCDPPQDSRRFNTLLLAPREDALLEQTGYPNVFVFGLPVPGAAVDYYIPDMALVETACGKLRAPGKEIMGQVFRLLAQRGRALLNTDAPRRALISWCIDVFEELGFLRCEQERLLFDKSCERRVLTQSNAFVCGQNNFDAWTAYLRAIADAQEGETSV